MKRLLVLTFLLVVSLGIALFVLLPDREAEEDVAGTAAPPADRVASPPIGDPESELVESVVQPEPTREPVVTQPDTDRPSTDPEIDEIVVHGTIVVVDAQGIEHGEEDGSFGPIVWKGDMGAHGNPVDVVDGRFELRMVRGQKLGFRKLVLGGRPARVQPETSLDIDAGTTIDVRAAWAPTIRLRIVDAVTGADLRGVTIVRASERPSWGVEGGPADGEHVVCTDRASPLALAPAESGVAEERWGVTLWAGASGYTWESTRCHWDTKEELTLALQPSAELVVHLDNYAPPPGEPSSDLEKPYFNNPGREPIPQAAPTLWPMLRVREAPDVARIVEETMARYSDLPAEELARAGMPSVAEKRAELEKQLAENPLIDEPIVEVIPDPGGTAVLAGLPPGTLLVSVEIGKWFEDSCTILGWTEAELEPGRRTEVRLALDDAPVFEPTSPLGGTFRLPPAWGELDVTLSLRPMDLPGTDFEDTILIPLYSMQPIAEDSGLYRWSAGQVIPGRYEAYVSSLATAWVLDVPPEGLPDVHLAIGEPAQVVVRLVEEETGQVVPLDSINWSHPHPEGAWAGGSQWVEAGEDPGVFRFIAPAGVLRIDLWSHEYTYSGTSGKGAAQAEVAPGENEITIELRRTCGLELAVDGVGDFDLHEGIRHLRILEVNGEGRAHAWTGGGGRLRITVSNPGTYEIGIHPFGVYEEFPPEIVRIPPGEFVEHTITLQPRR